MKTDSTLSASDNESIRVNRVTEHRDVDQGDNVAKGVGVGAALGGALGLLVGLASLIVPGIGPLIVAGPLISTLTGAGLGAVTGGLAGALTRAGIPDEQAADIAEGVRRGGTLVMVNLDANRADQARNILAQHHPADVRERAAAWRNTNELNTSGETQPQVSEDASDVSALNLEHEEVEKAKDDASRYAGGAAPGMRYDAGRLDLGVAEEELQRNPRGNAPK